MTEKWSRAVLRGLGSRKAPRLPDTVRQFPVEKHHSGTHPHGGRLGFKTIIKPSKEAIKRHVHEVKQRLRKLTSAPQEGVIKDLNR